MRYFVQSLQYLQEHFLSWLSFFVLTFFIEVFTLGLLSFQILRETKRAFLAKNPPSLASIWKDIPWEADIQAWFWFGAVRWCVRIAGLLFLWPIYSTCGGLWGNGLIFLGLFGYLALFVLTIFVFAIESMLTYWVQLLYINGYFSPKEALRVNWEYLKQRSRPIFLFCSIENLLHIPLLFTCVMPAVISRPTIIIALLQAYEEEREHILILANDCGIARK